MSAASRRLARVLSSALAALALVPLQAQAPISPASAATTPGYYKAGYGPTIYQVTSTSARGISFDEWSKAGFPAPRPSPTDYVRYPWSESVYAVTFWPGSWQWDRLSYPQWSTAGHPAVRHAGWIEGSQIVKTSSSPSLYLRDPEGVDHHLTYSEWAATGFRAPTVIAGPQAVSTDPVAPLPVSGTVSVGVHGAKPGDGVDDTAGIRAAFAAAASAGKAVTFAAGEYRVNGTLTVPNALTDIRMDARTVLRQFGDPKWGTLTKQGTVGTQYSVSPAARGATKVQFSNVAGLKVGSWVMLASDDVYAHKPMNPGHLRKVTAISGTTVTIDRPLNRALRTTPKAFAVTLAAPVSVTGGVFEHNNKLANFYPAISLHYVQSPVISTEIRNHGAAGVLPNGTVGGHLNLNVHDLVDDESGARFGGGRHYGYGVEAAGPTRDLLVTGECYAVRHCFTTNAAYQTITSGLRGYGDPEDIQVRMNVHDTTSTGLDTHEPGWNISFAGSTVTNPGRYRAAGSKNGKEGGGGVFVRARATRVHDITITGAMDDGITIARPPSSNAQPWQRDEWPTVRNARVLNGKGTNAMAAYQPAAFGTNVTVKSTGNTIGLRVDAGAKGTTVDGVTIDFTGKTGTTGILGSTNATIGNITYIAVSKHLG